MKRAVIDDHSHIGEIEGFPFYGLVEPVKPIVYDFPKTKDMLKFMDRYAIERALVMSNYGVPKPEQPFSLNPVVMEAAQQSDRIRGLL
ncbi:MAG: amidohydrolase, partial [Thermoleophilia bacterium]|nr:amidohydrolase [Thermoleophilia bacterium]